VGEAEDGKQALELIPQLNPDVITLDINMPVMDGLTALKHIMIRYPRPVVMCSTLTEEGTAVTFDALKFGAVDFIHKPSNQHPESLEAQFQSIMKKIIQAAGVEIGAVRYLRTKSKEVTPKLTAEDADFKCNSICAIGASEGGYGALLKIIPQLSPGLSAAFIITLHEISAHTDAFVRYLDEHSTIRVKRAVEGEPIKGGVCYLASREEYITVHSFYGEYLQLSPAPFPEQRGAVNMLMFSAADVMKERAVGVILSGTGNDGAQGLSEISNKGGSAYIQSPKSSLYKEMPESAFESCKTAIVMTDQQMPEEFNKRFAS
jgi:two-component system, chemotaxis family, protein-glutamate methylesterase/glutaminase